MKDVPSVAAAPDHDAVTDCPDWVSYGATRSAVIGLAPFLLGSGATHVPANGCGALPCGVAAARSHTSVSSSYW